MNKQEHFMAANSRVSNAHYYNSCNFQFGITIFLNQIQINITLPT